MNKIAILIIIAELSASCALRTARPDSETASAGGVDRGLFEGYEAINAKIRERLLDPDHPESRTFRLGMYLNVGRYSRGLTNLLGAYAGEGATNRYQNGDPSVVNTTLWHLSLKIFIWHFVSCEETRDREFYKIKGDAYHAVQNLCNWPDQDSFDEDDLGFLWVTFMGWEAPDRDFLSWREFVLDENSPLREMEATQAIQSMVHAIVLNPYFLLEN